MAETKFATIKGNAVSIPRDFTVQVKGETSQPLPTSVSLPSIPPRTIWDFSFDEVTATVFAELRF